ncbi:MAG: glycosyltransferase family 2 protein [Candidatus Saccharibacteria bacterium]
MLSVIVPTYNERFNLDQLLRRMVKPLNLGRKKFELIFVDDNSTDGSYEFLMKFKNLLPLKVLRKRGRQGKTYSLLEGFGEAQGDVIAMIDADLQYPPEAISEMVKQLKHYDIVVADRVRKGSVRTIFSRAYRFLFGDLLLGLPGVDVQSGLKVFKKGVLKNIGIDAGPWGFDYEFLFKANRLGWRIGSMPVSFGERQSGESKVSVVRDGLALALGAIGLRIRYMFRSIFKFLDYPHKSERLDMNFDNEKDFLFLPEVMSAKRHVFLETVALAAVLAVLSAAILYGIWLLLGVPFLITISAAIAVFYVVLMFFKFAVIHKSLKKEMLGPTPQEIASLSDDDLPMYTILIPLYKEAEVIGQIIQAMTAIDYPPEKLDVIITLEKYDTETIEAIRAADPPKHFRTLILPDVQPKTKPKALNVAFRQVKGEFLVIYDAEIMPDPDQLKKAVVAFRKRTDVDVLQTRLDHYNIGQSLITKLFNAEFSFHFDLFLPGLSLSGFPIPLSGHSTHFRTAVIREAGAWDPYNVTEDCDLGIRLARMGKRVEILDSVSREEATATADAWIGQRSRWIKGFIQTSIVHLRHPTRFAREIGGWKNFGAFLLTVPGSVVINVLNLFYWFLLVGWFTTHSAYIRAFFPGPIYYVSLASFIIGNAIFVYLNLIAAYKRRRFELVKYSLLSPLYWIMLAYASVKASVELMIKPHHWSKTKHGEHLVSKESSIKVPNYVVKTT